MTNMFARFVKEEDGATAIEYGLLAALISVVIIGAVTILGENIEASFTGIGDAVADANTRGSTP